MKHVYSNGTNPKTAIWLAGTFIIIGIASYVMFMVFFEKDDSWSFVFEVLYMILWGLSWFYIWKSTKCEIDDEAGTLIVPDSKKYPMAIANIDTVTYCQTKKGRLRYVTIHEKGTRFSNVNLARKQAEAMVAELLRLNPDITIEVANYY